MPVTPSGVSHEVAFNMYTDFAVGGVGQVGGSNHPHC